MTQKVHMHNTVIFTTDNQVVMALTTNFNQ